MRCFTSVDNYSTGIYKKQEVFGNRSIFAIYFLVFKGASKLRPVFYTVFTAFSSVKIVFFVIIFFYEGKETVR